MTNNIDLYNITLIASLTLMSISLVVYGNMLEPAYIEHLKIKGM
ncbi:hypothetical protein [uncultured Vibrio sp.]|nr:hypothetical protein [uncultured Vibrio sp.]